MNTFATVLLAFPFYLAVKGRLAAYVQLAHPNQSAASGASSTGASASTQPTVSTTPTTPNTPSLGTAAQNVGSIITGVASVADLA